MRITTAFYVLGVLLMLLSGTMLVPLAVSWWYNDGEIAPFLTAFSVTFVTGLLLWISCRFRRRELRVRDGFLVVVLFWTVLSLFSALPFIISVNPDLSFTQSVFEATSGLTTTGATVITGLDDLPRSILYYRQQLQFLGGLGIILLAVAVLPMLGIGGMQLFRAEMTGPVKDNKLTPRITHSAKALWYIYMGLTALCVTAYWLGGMTLFDAVGHGFSTVATGGFSTHDDSFAYFDSRLIESIAMVFMVVSAVSYALHYYALHRASITPYKEDAEFRTYITILFSAAVIVCGALLLTQTFDSTEAALQHGLFQVIAAGTTTGFVSTNFAVWPSFLPVMILFLGLAGGCAASTSGGFKAIRILLLHKQGMREIKRLIHPSGLFRIKIGKHVLPDRVVDTVWGYFATFTVVYILLLFTLIALGLDHVSAFAALTACISNLGPGIASVAENYAGVSMGGQWVLVLAMLLGRLEIFSLLVLLTPTFWRS